MSSIRTSTSLANQVVFSIILVVFSVTSIASTVLVWKRRYKHPIKGRNPRFLLLFNIVALIITVIPCVNAILPEDMPCLFINTHLFSWYFSSYSIRAFVLWFQFEQVEEALHDNSQSSTAASSKWSRDPLWFSKRRHLVSEKYTLMYALGSFVFCFISVPYLVYSGECYNSAPVSSAISALNNLILMVIGVFLGFKLRREFDLFWLRQELMYNTIFCVTGLFLWIGLLMLYYKPHEFYATTFIAVAITSIFLVFSSIVPLILSYRAENKLRSRSRKSSRISSVSREDKKDAELHMVLEDPEGYKLLEHFLAGEFAVENITFYKACKDFHALTDVETVENCIQKAWEIYNMYMKRNAPQEINISLASKELIKTRITEMKSNITGSSTPESVAVLKMLFEEAVKEVLRLIATDSFLRFKLLPETKDFLKKKATSNALSSMELL